MKVMAIDGPAASGKSTLARSVSAKLGIWYIDTGAMYRALGIYFKDLGISHFNDNLNPYLSNLNLSYHTDSDGNAVLFVQGVDVTAQLRTKEMGELASRISTNSSIRHYLVQFQRDLVRTKWCVMEGRDIGSVVFPQAFLKFYVTADLKVRAKRRYLELMSKSPAQFSLEEIEADLKMRDERDQNRQDSPLAKLPDAVLIDTTNLSEPEVTTRVCSLFFEKMSQIGHSFTPTL